MRRSVTAKAAAMTALLVVLATDAPNAGAAAGSDRLNSGERLSAGQSLRNSAGDSVVMQSDGNFVLYAPGGAALWSTGTSGHPSAFVVMQTDGNLVVYSSGGSPLWNAGTYHTGGYVVIQDDVNFVVYGSTGAKWQSDTRVKGYAANRLGGYGWANNTQYSCLNHLWQQESGWQYNATNPSSGAYGIPQSLPGNKMATAGSDWQTNPQTQIRWGQDYIQGRYGNPCAAESHEIQYGYY